VTREQQLRGAIIGLLGFAAAEEQMLPAAASAGEPGDAACWAARPVNRREASEERPLGRRAPG